VLMLFFNSKISPRTVDRDFAGKVACGDSGRNFGDVADLGRSGPGHGFTESGEIFPDTPRRPHLRLAAKLSIRTTSRPHE